ncbi:hypothetical protein [Sorangium sp. So ce131]|uniref:hypothetical protein n=1 Tax=Sorangium sp. So ce131 TaxID=3133282 RepID=UPI003F621B26
MKITAEQMRVFVRSADRAWVDELCQHLRAHHREAVARLGDEQLREEVARGIERARGHALYARSKVGFFVALLFEIGPGFDEHPRIRECMGPGRLSPDERLASLAGVISEEEWEEASRIPRPGRGVEEATERDYA